MSDNDSDVRIELARQDERLKSLEKGRAEDKTTVSTLATRLWGVVATVLGLVGAALFRSFGP